MLRNTTKILFFCWLFLFVTSCTIYTEKQTEALSRAVYATKDSLDKARIDAAATYSAETTRIVKPPKHRIPIESVYKTTTIPVVTSSSKPKEPLAVNKQRVLIIPEEYKNDTVVVVNSDEYQQLLKDKQTSIQLITDLKNERLFRAEVDKELQKQKEYSDQMIKDLNTLQKKIIEKDYAILKRNVVIATMSLMFLGAIYLRIKGIL